MHRSRRMRLVLVALLALSITGCRDWTEQQNYGVFTESVTLREDLIFGKSSLLWQKVCNNNDNSCFYSPKGDARIQTDVNWYGFSDSRKHLVVQTWRSGKIVNNLFDTESGTEIRCNHPCNISKFDKPDDGFFWLNTDENEGLTYFALTRYEDSELKFTIAAAGRNAVADASSFSLAANIGSQLANPAQSEDSRKIAWSVCKAGCKVVVFDLAETETRSVSKWCKEDFVKKWEGACLKLRCSWPEPDQSEYFDPPGCVKGLAASTGDS